MPGPPREWQAVTLNVPTRCEDELVGMVSHHVLGVLVDPGVAGMSTVELYVDSDEDVAVLNRSLAAACAQLGIESAPSVRPIPDGRWVEKYQESLRPFPAGERFMIHPVEESLDPDGNRIPILLVPGRAFGTGEHGTTRLCLGALERAVVRNSRWLDVGCGSGILSVAAAMLGAVQVIALDIDPDAVDVTREVAAANGVAGGIEVLEGSLAQVDASDFDGIVANIHAPFFLEHAAGLRQRVRSGGTLVCTGFLENDLVEILPELEAAGFTVKSCTQDGPWALVVATTAP